MPALDMNSKKGEPITLMLLGAAHKGNAELQTQLPKEELDYAGASKGFLTKRAVIDSESCLLHICDTSNIVNLPCDTLDNLIGQTQGFIFVYSASSHQSFADIFALHEAVLRVKGSRSPCVLVCTSRKSEIVQEVSNDGGTALAAVLGCQFFQLPAEDAQAPFLALVRLLSEDPKPALSNTRSWGVAHWHGQAAEDEDVCLVTSVKALSLPHHVHGTSSIRSPTSHPSLLSFSTDARTAFSVRYTMATTDSGGTDTIWGPGAFTGRALLAFGEATIRGLENLVIRRKLSAISSFVTRPSANSTNKTSILDDLLELCRVGLYSESVRERALNLLYSYVKQELDLGPLTNCLLKWPAIEIQLAVSTFSNFVDTKVTTEVKGMYYVLRAFPLLRLIWSLARADISIFRCLIEMGLFDMLLTFVALADEAPCQAVLAFCSTELSRCPLDSQLVACIVQHPFYALWPMWIKLDLGAPRTIAVAWAARLHTWPIVDRQLVQWRLRSIRRMLKGQVSTDKGDSPTDKDRWRNLIIDLQGFLRFRSEEPDDDRECSAIRQVSSSLLTEFVQRGEQMDVFSSCCRSLRRR